MKKPGFAASLNRSTKITLASCLFFIVLTCIILLFFVLFPITPSEKIMASIGRENMLNGGGDGGQDQMGVPVVVTTDVNADDEQPATSEKYTGTTTTRTVNIRITTGSGFLWGGRIPTGTFGGDYPTTPVDDPDVPTFDPGTQVPVDPTYPGYDPNGGEPATEPGGWQDPTEPGYDPGTGGDPGTDPGTGGDPGSDPGTGGDPGTDPGTGGDPGTDPGTGGVDPVPSPDPAE